MHNCKWWQNLTNTANSLSSLNLDPISRILTGSLPVSQKINSCYLQLESPPVRCRTIVLGCFVTTPAEANVSRASVVIEAAYARPSRRTYTIQNWQGLLHNCSAPDGGSLVALFPILLSISALVAGVATAIWTSGGATARTSTSSMSMLSILDRKCCQYDAGRDWWRIVKMVKTSATETLTEARSISNLDFSSQTHQSHQLSALPKIKYVSLGRNISSNHDKCSVPTCRQTSHARLLHRRARMTFGSFLSFNLELNLESQVPNSKTT